MTDVQPHLQKLALDPADASALAAVEAAYSQQGRWEELLRVYEDNALRGSRELAAALLRRAAKVCLEQLTSAPRAEIYLRRALDADPASVDSLAALRQLYLAKGQYEPAVEIYERELARVVDARAKAQGLVEVARLYRDKLGRVDKALAVLRQAQRADAKYAGTYSLNAAIYEEQGRLDRAVRALQSELEAAGPQGDVLARLGALATRLLEHPKMHDLALSAVQAILSVDAHNHAGTQVKAELEVYKNSWPQKVAELEQRVSYYAQANPAQAAEMLVSVAEIQLVYGQANQSALLTLDRVMGIRPGHRAGLRLMEEIYGAEERWGELAMKLETMAAYTREPAVAVDLYLQAAMHNAVRMDNPDASARIYHRVLELDPGNKVASNALAEFYRERKMWKESLEILSAWAGRATQAADAVAAHYACSRILEEELGDKVGARPHYEAILAVDPENQAAARALEEVYRAAGDHAALARALRAKLAGSSADERRGIQRELGDLLTGPLDKPAEALAVLGDLYREQPEPALRERLEELAARSDGFAALVQILEGALERIDADADRVRALHSLAALYEGARDAPLEALRINRRILTIDPNDSAAAQNVERLLHVAAEAGDKVAFYREQVEAASSDKERLSILFKLADELTRVAKDYVQAIDIYHRILKLAPNNAVAMEALLALYRRDNRWAEVADVLGQKLGHMPEGSSERLPILLELAQIWEHRLGQVERAVAAYCSLLRQNRGSAEAREGLERLISRTASVREVAELLQPSYEAAGQWDRVVAMYEIRIKEASDQGQRSTLLQSLAGVCEQRLQRPDHALAVLLRAFQVDPGDASLQVELERLAEATGDLRGIVRAYRSAGLVHEGADRQRFFLRAGSLAERSGDVPGAALDYLRALGLKPEGDKAALEGLARLLSAGLDSTKLVESAEQVGGGMEGQQVGNYWRAMARFYEGTMRSSTDAIAAWKAVLAAHTNDPQAMAELDRLYQASGSPAQLVEHLRAKLAVAADDAARAALVGQIAEVLAEQLNDVGTAIEELKRASEMLPGERLVWERMGALCQKAGRPQEAALALHQELNLLPEGPERVEKLVQYASVLGRDLGDPVTAASALQGVFAQNAAHPGATQVAEGIYAAVTDPMVQGQLAQALLASYEASQQWAKAAQVLAARVDNLTDLAERARALRKIAKLKAEKLNDASGAYRDLEKAFLEQPTDDTLRVDLERIAEACNGWEALAAAYNAALGVIGDPSQQRPIRRKLAEVLDTRLGRGAEAVEHYKALGGEALPTDLPSLEAMERLLRSQGQVTELAEVIGRILHLLGPEQQDRRKALLLELGQLCEQQLADKPRAIDAYRQLVALDAKSQPALRRLEALLFELNQPAEVAAVLGKLIDLGAANTEILNDYMKLAVVQQELGNFDEAFKSYRAALMKKRDHQPAIDGLEALMQAAPNKLDIAQVLEPLYTAKQDHAKLAWVLEQRLIATTDLAQRKSLLRRIGDIYENRLQQKDRAFAMARRSMSEDPADMGVRMWIEKLAGETGALAELATAYVEEAAKADAQLKLQFHRRAAALYHEKLSDLPAAVGQYKAILEQEPRDEKALTGLETIFRQTQDSTELVALLKRRLALTAGLERKRDYLKEIATIEAQALGDPASAIASFREMLKITPEDQETFAQIEALYAQAGQFEELAKFYEGEERRLAEKRGRDSALRRLQIMHRRARVVAEQFGDHEFASTVFEAILSEEPKHTETLAYLDAAARGGNAIALATLDRAYRKQGNWQKLVDLLDMKLQQTAETGARRAVYLDMAQIYDEQLKAGDMAFLSLTRAFNENRADVDLLARMEAVTAKYDNWEELLEVLSLDLDAIPDPDLRQTMLRKVGMIAGEKLNKVNQAVQAFQTALQYNPSDAEALAALDALLAKNEMWAALADLLERRIDLAAEPGAKSALLERLAGVWGDKLMDAEAALRCHQQILEIDPDHPISLKSMQKLYAEVQDWDALAVNLSKQAEVLKSPEDQVRIHAAAGELYAEELGDNAQAISHWQKVLEFEPAHEAGNQALDILLTAEERWEELASHYRRQLTHTQDPAAKLEINQRLGVILGDKLGQSEDALGSWLQVVQQDPKNKDAMRALLGLYTDRAMWQEFVGIARRMIPLCDPAEAKEVRFQLAKALGENLGQREEAIKLAREVRATEPHTAEQLRRLGEMLCNIEAYDEAVVALEKSAALEADEAAKVARYYQAAALYRDKLNKPNDARGAYEAVLQARPNDKDAFAALTQIYRDTSEWRKLVAINDGFVEYAEPDLRIAILTEVRDVHDQKLGEKEMAFIAACRVYKENPQDLSSAEVLERIALETEGAEEAAAVLEDEVEHIVDVDVKVAVYRRIARLYAEEIEDVASAEKALERILAIVPGDAAALDMLATLGAKEERFDKQIAALEQKLQATQEDTAKKNILFEVARIWEDKVGEIEEAIKAINRILEIDGADMNALDAAARIYTQEDRWTDLAHVLTRKVELTQEPKQNVELRMQVAALCEGELSDNEAALQWYRGVLDFEPGHAAALAALERLYTNLERWSELIQIYELQVSQTQVAEEQIKLLGKEATIYESEFESAKDAAACYERVVQIDPQNQAGLKHLERLLRQLGSWNRLIEILEHHITLLKEADEITSLYLEIGDIYYRELSRVDKAEQIYSKARELNPHSAAALHALGQLYERSGNWFQSLEMLQKEVDELGTDAAAVPILVRIGKMNEDMLGDIEAAKTAYKKALEINPQFGPALEAIKGIARQQSDWEAYAEYLITEAESEEDPEAKTELFHEAAKFFQEVRQDEESAVRFYTRALDISPDHLESAGALAEIYFRTERWEQANELYTKVVDRLDKTVDPKDYCQKCYRLAYVSEKLGERDKALEYYRRASEADSSYLPALEGLGQALIGAGSWDEAQKVFQTILIHHRDALTESEIVDVQWQLGDICMKQEQPDRAYRQFEKALDIDPDHAPSLRALAQIDRAMQNWESAWNRLSRVADVAPGPERVEMLREMSDIAQTNLGDTARAIDALERIRRLPQPPLDVIVKLAELYTAQRQAQKVIEVLEQGATLELDPEQMSDVNFRLGVAYQSLVSNLPVAVQKYNAALDASPKNTQAFEALERLLSEHKQWGLLEQNYIAMIKRSMGLSEAFRLVLWRQLGELYRRVLRNLDGAIQAYTAVDKIKPNQADVKAVLAELFAQKPEHRKKAIETYHEQLRTQDDPVQIAKVLRKLYHAERDFDAVYVLCGTLAVLNAADDEERQIFQYLQQGIPPKASGGLIEDHWPAILHPGINCPIGVLAALLYRGAADVVTVPSKDLGLKKKDQIDLRASDLYIANVVRYVAKLLNIQGIDFYRKSGSMEALHLVNAQPPALVAGENNDLFRGAAQKSALYHIGRTLAYARPELFLARIYPGDELRNVLVGLCLVYNRALQHNADPREAARWTGILERLPQQTLRRLQEPARLAFADLIKPRSVAAYLAAVEHTASRAGLIASGDLPAAMRGLQEGGEGATNVAVRDRAKELVLYAVSKEHLQLRKIVGAAFVEPQGQAQAPAR